MYDSPGLLYIFRLLYDNKNLGLRFMLWIALHMHCIIRPILCLCTYVPCGMRSVVALVGGGGYRSVAKLV